MLAGDEKNTGSISLALGTDVIINDDRLLLKVLWQGSDLGWSALDTILLVNVGKLCLI
jgi:hypothetical protein